MSEPTDDPFFEALRAKDPAPLLHRLREEDPVHHVAGLDLWLVTRHDDIKRLFHDPENVTGDRHAWARFAPRPEGSRLRWLDDGLAVRRSPEAHARFRGRFNRALTPRAVRRMDAQIREVVERFAAPLRARRGDVVDFVEEFTNPIPNTVISRITGVSPGDDEERFRELAQGFIRGFFPFAQEEALDYAEKCLGELVEIVGRLARERRGSLGEDLVSDLLRSQADDDSLSDDEIVQMISILLGAGSETTNFGGRLVVETLVGHPRAFEKVRADRSQIPRVLGEVLRFAFAGPVGITRFAVRDFALRGKPIRKGQMLMLSFGGANRDPEVFDDPDRLDLERDTRELLVFGNGPHYCLGANLARQEMGTMLDAALDIVTPGSFIREDLRRSVQLGVQQRSLNLPVELAD